MGPDLSLGDASGTPLSASLPTAKRTHGFQLREAIGVSAGLVTWQRIRVRGKENKKQDACEYASVMEAFLATWNQAWTVSLCSHKSARSVAK